MAAREDILGRIAATLGGGERAEAAATRIARHAANLVPARAQVGRAEQIRLFTTMMESVEGTVVEVPAPEVPQAVADYLIERNLPSAVAMAPDPALDALPWGDQPLLALRRGRAEESDVVGITGAFAGIAETGTLMLLSGPGRPTALGFLPENHIVILPASGIVGTYEEAWQRLREACAAPHRDGFLMPRTVNLITGPSRTADIELIPTLGAHGPKRLHTLIVDDGQAA